MIEDQDNGRYSGERLNAWEYATVYVSYRRFAALVGEISHYDVDMVSAPHLRLQLFELACHHLRRLERRWEAGQGENIFIRAFDLVFTQPGSLDNNSAIHYPFLMHSDLFRLVTSSKFYSVIDKLVPMSYYLSNECLCLVLEDVITGFSDVNAGNVAFNEQFERARNHAIGEIIYAMGNTGVVRWGQIFLFLFERASGEPRTVSELDGCGSFETHTLRSVREQLIFAAEQGFNEAGRRGIAEEILRVAVLREMEISQLIFLIPLIRCAYERNGATLFIRRIFERDERDAKLGIIDEVRELSEQLYFQASGEGAVYAKFLGEFWEKESDFEVKQQLNRLVFQLKGIDQEAAQRELEAVRLRDRVGASSFSRRLPWMWS